MKRSSLKRKMEDFAEYKVRKEAEIKKEMEDIAILGAQITRAKKEGKESFDSDKYNRGKK